MIEGSVTFSFRYQARCLCSQPGANDKSRWIVGTNSLREDNEVTVLEYDSLTESLTTAKSYVHPQEMWDVAPSPSSSSTFVTVHSKVGVYAATIWGGDDSSHSLTSKATLVGHQGVIRRAVWHCKREDLVVTAAETGIMKWTVGDQGAQNSGKASAGEIQLWSAALHPVTADMAATAGGNNIQLWDLRTMSKTAEIQGAHRMPTRDVDFAPHLEHRLLSCGDDCKLRIWDLRTLGKAEALVELGGHSHWVWKAKYNPFHDQLLASASSDCLVNLYSTPLLARAAESNTKPQLASTNSGREADGKVHSYDEHEDSVYGLAWSSVDPWCFASLSYDGRLVVNKVPKAIKYKVLV